jgi:glutathione S-transferase
MAPTIYIGNKNYSSWSLRPWLALKWAGIPVEERIIPLGEDGFGTGQTASILAVSPSGCVPVLHLGETRIWDSLAICEWAAESKPDAGLWPSDRTLRAVCRSVTCEMHSGFGAMRRDLSMNIRRRTTARNWPQDTLADIARVQALWTNVRREHGAGGPFLFGSRTLADAFFVPVATRFRTYGVALDEVAREYVATLLNDAAFLEWERAAESEPWTLARTDAL